MDTAFNWRTCWYPIAFAVDLPPNGPYGFSIFAEPFVLFQDEQGRLICLKDRCPHRLAKLSDGQLREGRLECLYHGWQFGSEGKCLHIPHLLEGAEMPARAQVEAFPVQVQQEIVWVWADAKTAPDPAEPPTVDEIDQEGVFKVDTATDFPFDHTFLVENLLDPAHVYISHDRTELGIRREDAQPLEMEVLSTSTAGISGRFRKANNSTAPWTAINFHAPMLVHYSFSNPAYGIVGGLALYALPVAYGHSRILVRRYGNFFKRPFTLKPRWLEHLRQNKILEEDLSFIVAQDRFFRETGQGTQSAYFPLKTCDTLVMAHRRWLDQFGQDLPWYVGFSTVKSPTEESLKQPSQSLSNRFERHTQNCQACRDAHQRLVQGQRVAQWSMAATLATGLITQSWVQMLCILGFVLSAAIATTAQGLRQQFENPLAPTKVKSPRLNLQ
ncbi:MAG: Rieske 2Fe-2S domain-containing protein [Cyanobacteria bacterium J06632_22]